MPFFDPRLPFLRRAAVDVKHDRLHRLGDFRVGVLLFQSPAGDVADVLDLVADAIAVVFESHREEADAFVEAARLHRILGQLDHAVVQQHRDAALRRIAPWATTLAGTAFPLSI